MTEKKKTFGERHIYTQEIMRILQDCPVGETAKYADLEELIGLPVRPGSAGYGYQKTARDILERDHDMVFEAVDNIGLRRMSHEEVAASTAAIYVDRKKSMIKRHLRRIATVDDHYDELTHGGKMQTTMARTLLAFDSETVRGRHVRAIERKVEEKQRIIGFEETIAMFKK